MMSKSLLGGALLVLQCFGYSTVWLLKMAGARASQPGPERWEEWRGFGQEISGD